MTHLRTDGLTIRDPDGEAWSMPVEVYQCDGCKRELPENDGLIDDEDGIHWCPFCAFKLGKLDANEFMSGWRHWHGQGFRKTRPILTASGEIAFIGVKKLKHPLKARNLTKGKRFAVLERDGFRCRYCGATPDITQLHIDHVRAKADGGCDDESNLVVACVDCNLGKSDRSIKASGVPS